MQKPSWLRFFAVGCGFLRLVAVDSLDKGGCGFYTGYENRNQPQLVWLRFLYGIKTAPPLSNLSTATNHKKPQPGWLLFLYPVYGIKTATRLVTG